MPAAKDNRAVLQCDACHHEEPVFKISKRLVGKPCPICLEPMFTAEHWRSYQRVQVWVWVSKILTFLMPWVTPKTYRIRVGKRFSEIRDK